MTFTHPIRQLCASLCIVVAVTATADAGLVIRQRSNGLPGKARDSVTVQELLVGKGVFRLRDLETPTARYLIVRLDREVIWEVDPALELYTETAFQVWRKKREEAEGEREETRKAALRKLSGEELARKLKEIGLREDGKRLVTVERGPVKVVEGARMERIAILLNGQTQVAVWETDRYQQYKPPQELFDFYDKCGVFPPDVTEKLKQEVTLFPIRIHANIDLFSVGTVIETSVDAVAEWPESGGGEEFKVPSNYRKVDEFPKEKIEKKTYACPVCGTAVDPVAAPHHEKDPATGEKVYFDDEECWIKYQLQRKRR